LTGSRHPELGGSIADHLKAPLSISWQRRFLRFHTTIPRMSPETGELLILEVAPRNHSLAPSLVPIGCEDLEELAQDATEVAAALLSSAAARAKAMTPGNVAFYAIALIRQGRRSSGEPRMTPCTRPLRSVGAAG
jgi:hypothetical protein